MANKPIAESHPFELDVCTNCEGVFQRPDPSKIATLAVRPVLMVRWISTLGAKKTFGTKKSAYRRYAWMKIRERYKCDSIGGFCEEDGTFGPSTVRGCWGIHHPWREDLGNTSGTADGNKSTVQYLQARFVRWLMWRDAHVRGGQRLARRHKKKFALEVQS